MSKVGGKDIDDQAAVFPLVIIKDPYHWAISQCRHKYFTIWEHDNEHCPNIVNVWDKVPTDVTVKYAETIQHYETLLGLWNDWYTEYENQKDVFPLAYVRFEDILFNPEHVVEQVCTCVGGHTINKGKFNYKEDSAKPDKGTHKGANGLVSSILRYGNPNLRLEGWTKLDYDYAQKHLNMTLMTRYGYSTPIWEGDESDSEKVDDVLTLEQAIGKYSNWHTTYYKAFTSSHISFFRAGISRSTVCSELTSSSGSR